MDILNIVEIFGIYVWLVSIISENKKIDKFCEVKNIETPKHVLLLPHHHPKFVIWNMNVLYT